MTNPRLFQPTTDRRRSAGLPPGSYPCPGRNASMPRVPSSSHSAFCRAVC